MSQMPIIIFGGDQELLELVKYYFETDAARNVVAITMNKEFIKEKTILGLNVIPFEELLDNFPPNQYELFVALSYSKVNQNRRRICQQAITMGYTLASYISSKATKFDTFKHGYNCFVLEDNTLQPFSKIGNGVTLWSGNHIGHHSIIRDYCFVSSQVVVSGSVEIGELSFLGVNSTINDSLKVGSSCVIGSGSLISKNIADNSVVSCKGTEVSKIPSYKLRNF